MKTHAKFGDYENVIRGCVSSSSCQAKSYYFAGNGVSIGCCTTNDCNAAGSLRVEYYALIFTFILSVFVQLLNHF